MKTAKGGPIPGVKATDKYTLQIKLTEPQAAIVVASMVLPYTAPVPEEYAKKFDAKKPSEYGNYQVATGPYMLKNDAAGKVLGIGYQPGKSATLVRNPNWNASTDFRPAYLDQINISIGGDPNVIGRQVLEGSHMVQTDAPAAPILKLAFQQHRSQLQISPARRGRPLHRDQQQRRAVQERQPAQGAVGGDRPRSAEQAARRQDSSPT